LSALSEGLVGGLPEAASSLSAGDFAARDEAEARALGDQRAARSTTDYGFDILSVTARPLDGGAGDLIAFEKVHFHSGGVAKNIVGLYHRAAGSAVCKAVERAYVADNLGVPALRLDSGGSGHLLLVDETQALASRPEDLAGRYAAVVSTPSGAVRLPGGSFEPGQFTSGEITELVDAASILSAVGATGSGWRYCRGARLSPWPTVSWCSRICSKSRFATREPVDMMSYLTVQDQKRSIISGR
jgi:hypothetical protein